MIMNISENYSQPCSYFQTSVTNFENSHNISVISEKIDILNDNELVTRIFETFFNKFIVKTCFTKEQENIVIKFLILSVDELIDNENTKIQMWQLIFEKNSSFNRHNFGKVVKRNKNMEPTL